LVKKDGEPVTKKIANSESILWTISLGEGTAI
jgi:hypothetical protein